MSSKPIKDLTQLPTKLTSGHRLCAGCAESIIARQVLMATDKPIVAAENADVILTDVWSSMGMEAEIEKRKIAFAGYQVNDDIMAAAHSDAMVMHCLPAHRGEEITEKVFEAHAGEIFDEAENRLHAQKAVMVKLMMPEEA